MYNRTITPFIKKDLFQGKTIILYGARQVGKTTLVKKIIEQTNKTTRYLDGEILEHRQALETSSLEQLKHFLGRYELVIIDEAQHIKDIGRTLKIIHDHLPHIQVIATGSSSFNLSNQVNEPLTGRAIAYQLFPLSYQEITNHVDPIDFQSRLEQIFQFGWYPDVTQSSQEDAQRNLQIIAQNYLYQDILEHENLKKSDQLTDLLQLLALQIGGEVSYSELGQRLGLNTVTVQKYIHLLEQTFVIFRLRGLSRNLRNEISKSVKIYFWDIGVRNSLIRNHNNMQLRTDTGAVWENFFIAERLKHLRNQQLFFNAYFWRTYGGAEIDLVEERDGKFTAFECKWNPKKNARLPKTFDEYYQPNTYHVVHPNNWTKFVVL